MRGCFLLGRLMTSVKHLALGTAQKMKASHLAAWYELRGDHAVQMVSFRQVVHQKHFLLPYAV